MVCYIRNFPMAFHSGCTICVPTSKELGLTGGAGLPGLQLLRVVIGVLFQLAFPCQYGRCLPFSYAYLLSDYLV